MTDTSIHHIRIDDREHSLIALLPSATVAHLPVGDIWIGLDGEHIMKNGILIERKSIADLEASILDNRYREQRSRLMAYATEKGAHVAYIIEGFEGHHSTRCLSRDSLQKFLTRLALRYHIAVFHTSGHHGTADLCLLMADQLTKDPTTFEQPSTMTYIETRGNTRQGNTDDPAVFAANVLMCCRGISAAGATALLAAFGSLAGVWNASREALAAAPFGKKSFGAAKAGKLYELLHGDEEGLASAPSAPCPAPSAPAVTKAKKVVRKVASASLASSCMIQDE